MFEIPLISVCRRIVYGIAGWLVGSVLRIVRLPSGRAAGCGPRPACGRPVVARSGCLWPVAIPAGWNAPGILPVPAAYDIASARRIAPVAAPAFAARIPGIRHGRWSRTMRGPGGFGGSCSRTTPTGTPVRSVPGGLGPGAMPLGRVSGGTRAHDTRKAPWTRIVRETGRDPRPEGPYAARARRAGRRPPGGPYPDPQQKPTRQAMARHRSNASGRHKASLGSITRINKGRLAWNHRAR
ncbi:hypothetical protein BMOU_0449 [Bifidobacterium moukalabense DSM 27321]|uniref:Uncharacterized protein n=1 Tax=Bifidobacterium moukalabense DSM 27321 TaxID=1435051 RepID=W4NBH5_9BIFI|nr:hypothetical protein BMOU_0449 [Bifidobacterium moukalabense DSM 27321]